MTVSFIDTETPKTVEYISRTHMDAHARTHARTHTHPHTHRHTHLNLKREPSQKMMPFYHEWKTDYVYIED